MSTWKFAGIERDPPPRHPQQHSFTRWRIPFIGRGAIGRHGSGHWRALGLTYSWNDNAHFGWSKTRTLRVGGLLRISHEESGPLKVCNPGFRFRFAKLRWPLEMVR